MRICGKGRVASAVAGAVALALPVAAQMHAVKKPETVVRAVGVYEWTGDVAKPAASRLIPVTLFIDGSLQDAGVYLARPVPMALETGTIFELDQSGVPKGLLDLAFARHLQPSEESAAAPYDDGWFGYGQYKALPTPKLTPPSSKARLSKATVQSSKPDTARPRFSSDNNKSQDSTSSKSASTTASSDPDRPTMRRRDDSGSTSASTPPASSSTPTTTASTSKPDEDPNRPTMKRRDDSSPSTTSTPTASSTPTSTASTSKSDDTDKSTTKPSSDSTTASADDPDRPTMKRRSDSSGDTSSTNSSDSKTSSNDASPDRPTMKRRSDSDSTTASVPADDPDRPTMKKRSDSSGDTSSTTSSDSKTSSSDADPDRPTMKRRSDSDSTTASAPADDPDRPTLKKRTPAEKKAAQKGGGASVSEVGSLNDDPNRPNLHRGKPTHAMTDDDLPKLIGLPPDLHQMVAVSDAVDRPQHDFSRAWESKEEQETVLEKMRELARDRLKTYAGAAPAPPPPAKPTVVRTGTRRSKTVNPPPPPLPLSDEVLKAYTLSYGGAPTYAFSASSPSPDGASIQYVTVIAQADTSNGLRVALDNVTDSRHLDRTPRLRLVDVVDAEASNRASLLIELRAQHSRSFALYRLIGAQAEQVFSTGSTQ